MDPLVITIVIILHAAAASLHGYLVFCFYPDRYQYPALNNFMWVMFLCALFHITDVAHSSFLLMGWSDAVSVAYIMHLFVGYSLSPFMISNLMAEYTRLPDKPNIIARLLQKISVNAKPLSYVVLAIAYSSLSIRIVNMLAGGDLNDLPVYAIHANSIIKVLGVIWLIMIASGLRSSEQSYGYNRKLVLWIRVGFVAFVLLMIFIDRIYMNKYDDIFDIQVMHFVTVPFAIVFSWYRYRWVLVDVILKKAVAIFVILSAIWFGMTMVPLLDAFVKPLAVFLIAISAVVIARCLGYFFDSLWLPKSDQRNQFRHKLPLLIGRCVDQEQSIDAAERALAELFDAEVGINRPIANAVETITIDEEPVLHIELGYIKGHYPWFSETIAIANEVALYLHNHLKVLELRAAQHLQELGNRELETLAARAERDAMRMQIRPHFLFNVLNAIHSFVQQKPKQAEKMIELLADLMRGVVRSPIEDTYPLYNEIDLVKTYLTIEKIRYGDRLSFTIDVDEDLLPQPILPFSIQPLVENAVKYSVDTRLGQADIKVTAYKSDGQLRVIVTDNGPGPTVAHPGDGLGMALNNIRERLDKLYGERGSLLLQPGQELGTHAILSMPWLDVEQNGELTVWPLAP